MDRKQSSKYPHIYELIPTFILIVILFYSLFLRDHGISWINWFVLGIVRLGVYIPIAIFIEGIAKSFHYDRPIPIADKIYYGYMIGLWVIVLFVAIYSMGHN